MPTKINGSAMSDLVKQEIKNLVDKQKAEMVLVKQKLEGDSSKVKRAFFIRIKLSTLPPLAEEKMHMERKLPIQPWQREQC